MLQSLTLAQISELVDGEIISQSETLPVQLISIDSRNIIQAPQSLFVALKGAKTDGHEFLSGVFEAGVKTFIVQKGIPIPLSLQKNGSVVSVDNPQQALQKLAKYQRFLFKGPVVGITGSNGKTIVKEWLGQVIAQRFAVAKSPKSYNSQVGVPLSIFGIEQNHQVAILEAGISGLSEMGKLAAMIAPEIGIFTNIGTAHEEGFESQDQKLAEKALLFKYSKYIIYRKEHTKIHDYLSSKFDRSKLISWSEVPGSDYSLSVKKENDRSKILLIKPDLGVFTFSVPFSDQASLENVRHAIVASLSLGLEESLIQKGLDHLKTVDMRLTLKPGLNDCLIIDDTYNNDLAGLKLALDFMATQRPKRRKVVILSDLLQVGDMKAVYGEIGLLLEHHRIDYLLGVGDYINKTKGSFGGKSKFFPDTASLLLQISEEDFDNDIILVTGARKYGFEALVNRLQQRIHGTTLEINLNALTHNFNFYKTQLLPSTKVMVMVKAFAYGGGAAEIANHLQHLRADYLAVAYTDEGVSLREAGIRLPIMVLNPVQESFIHLEKFDLEPVVYSPVFFQQIGRFCQSQNIVMKIHLDLDTGMHRLGFEEIHFPRLLSLIKSYPQLKIASLYTHLVGADEEIHKDFSLAQLQNFTKMCDALCGVLDNNPMRHALNSAGIIQFPDFQMDMVRLGIGLYGVEVSGKFEKQLLPISTLKTTISQIKSIPQGQTIGYSRKGKMEENGTIATIALGYADGYDRRFSNGYGFVLIHGKKAPVIGNVCMDMTMINITGIEANEGDEVIIYGPGISLKELSEKIGTIPYELLTNISSRVKRVYYLD